MENFNKLINEVLDLLATRFDIISTPNNEKLQKFLLEQIKNRNLSVDEYIELIKKDKNILNNIIGYVLNSTNIFFHPPEIYKPLITDIIPQIIEHKKFKNIRTIRIWNPNCGTGECIYSLSIILNKLLTSEDNFDIKLIGTDNNIPCLIKANLGIYDDISLSTLDFNLRRTNFVLENSVYRIKPNLCNVTFELLNLLNNDYPIQIDFIFFNNLNFDIPIEKLDFILEKFHKSLEDDGILYINLKELTNFCKTKFKPVIYSDIMFLQKIPSEEENNINNNINIEIQKELQSYNYETSTLEDKNLLLINQKIKQFENIKLELKDMLDSLEINKNEINILDKKIQEREKSLEYRVKEIKEIEKSLFSKDSQLKEKFQLLEKEKKELLKKREKLIFDFQNKEKEINLKKEELNELKKQINELNIEVENKYQLLKLREKELLKKEQEISYKSNLINKKQEYLKKIINEFKNTEKKLYKKIRCYISDHKELMKDSKTNS